MNIDKTTLYTMRALIDARENVAFNSLKKNVDYNDVCNQQDKSSEVVETLYQRFEKNELLEIRHHYEGETLKMCYEIKSAYIQGMRDCFALLGFLNGTEIEV